LSLGISAPIVFGLLRLRGGLDLETAQELRFFRLLIAAAAAVAVGAVAHGVHKVITDSQLELISSRIDISPTGKRIANGLTKLLIVVQAVAWMLLVISLVWALFILFSPIQDRRMAVGDSVRAGDAVVTLNSTCTLTKVGSQKPKVDHVFLAANLTVENVSGQTISVSDSLDFTLKAKDGHQLNQVINDDTGGLGEGSLDSHKERRGIIVYEAPYDAHGLHLQYGVFGKDKTYTWLIGDASKARCGKS
jgi:uncharacterized protein DUF4352